MIERQVDRGLLVSVLGGPQSSVDDCLATANPDTRRSWPALQARTGQDGSRSGDRTASHDGAAARLLAELEAGYDADRCAARPPRGRRRRRQGRPAARTRGCAAVVRTSAPTASPRASTSERYASRTTSSQPIARRCTKAWRRVRAARSIAGGRGSAAGGARDPARPRRHAASRCRSAPAVHHAVASVPRHRRSAGSARGGPGAGDAASGPDLAWAYEAHGIALISRGSAQRGPPICRPGRELGERLDQPDVQSYALNSAGLCLVEAGAGRHAPPRTRAGDRSGGRDTGSRRAGRTPVCRKETSYCTDLLTQSGITPMG